MTPSRAALLVDALEYLQTLHREAVLPPQALTRLETVRRRCSPAALDLVWEEQVCDGSMHYDLLLHLAGEGTVSLSYCPERTLPWPLRGVHRWSDRELLRVNQTTLNVDQAIACLDFVWDEARLVERLVNVCLIQEALTQEPIQLSDAELQEAMNAFRRGHRLYGAEETRRWMERRGLTHEKLERLVADQATVARLRERVTAGRVEPYFQEHRRDFDVVKLARLDFADEARAEQVRGGARDFYETAQRQFVANAAPGPLFVLARRRELPAGLARVLFAAAPGEVVGPVTTETGFTLALVLTSEPAQLDDATRIAIKKLLFEQWLEERRATASIEWFWGNVSRTP